MDFGKRQGKNRGLLKDNSWLFAGFFLQGSFSYIYHLFMGRILGPEDYGVLVAILSISYLIMVFIETIQLTITKLVSKFKAKLEFQRIKYLLIASLKRMFIYGGILCFTIIIFSPFITSFLKIKNLSPIVILGLFIITSFLLAVTRGVLQGLQKFKELATNYITEGFVKFICGVGLVLFGYGVSGALGGIAISFLVAFVFSFSSIKLAKKIERFNFGSFYLSSFKTLITLASLTFIYSIDVILVKHFFNAAEAGYYAALSTLGKIIFFASYSVSYVMFSKIPEYEKNKKTKTILYKSLILITIISIPILLFYFLFPEFSIKLLFGSDFLSIKNYLGLFGVVITLFSLVYTVSLYNLSLDRKNFIYLLLIFNILEIVLIFLFHNSIIQIVYILLFLMLILLVILLISTGVFKYKTFVDNPGV